MYNVTVMPENSTERRRKTMHDLPIMGILAAAASLTIILVGMPKQIRMNYRRKSCEGIEPSLIYSVSITYVLWSIYGWTEPDWFLAASQTPGAVLVLILLFQLIHYRKKKIRPEDTKKEK